jgi:hypothetical protein
MRLCGLIWLPSSEFGLALYDVQISIPMKVLKDHVFCVLVLGGLVRCPLHSQCFASCGWSQNHALVGLVKIDNWLKDWASDLVNGPYTENQGHQR